MHDKAFGGINVRSSVETFIYFSLAISHHLFIYCFIHSCENNPQIRSLCPDLKHNTIHALRPFLSIPTPSSVTGTHPSPSTAAPATRSVQVAPPRHAPTMLPHHPMSPEAKKQVAQIRWSSLSPAGLMSQSGEASEIYDSLVH